MRSLSPLPTSPAIAPPVNAPSTVALWHGAGNTFALHDGLGGAPPPDPAALCGRFGVDGAVFLSPPQTPGAAAGVAFFNPDGTPAAACGNGLRCAAAHLDPHGARGTTTFDTPAGLRTAAVLPVRGGPAAVRVSMGKPRFRPPPADPRAFAEFLPNHRPTGDSGRPGLATYGPPIRVDLGNPHAVFLVDEPPGDDLVGSLGPALQTHPLFAADGGVNVGFAFARSPDAITLRVYERGVGETASCGSGACAAVAAAIAVRRCVRRVTVSAPGGDLTVDWPAAGEMFLTGPAAPLSIG
ncbi:diaminopimelate epimerase [Alienimonas sp. DA493]|uniref:diaminopimelate epimerase n=1 Tax=Alienimonas sp. DA493 TaxID=3373605 RepID=UPI0037543F1D